MSTRTEILRGAALAFFACAWADAAEESGNARIFSGKEILNIMPRIIDESAYHAARTLANDMFTWNGQLNIEDIYARVESMDTTGSDRELTPDLFGYYCAMQAMGQGVGLESFGYECRAKVHVPYLEFGSHSLQKDYF